METGFGTSVPGAQGTPAPKPEPSALGMLLALASATGIAASITVLYLGMGNIMETAGGFVATGGPYVIANEAPGWAWVMPVSVFGLLVFLAISLVAGFRGWGISLTILGWMGLFISLGWNFLRLGFNPPPNMKGAAAWIVCGVVFWLLGFGPALLFWPLRRAWEAIVARQSSTGARRFWTPPTTRNTTGIYLAAQAIGALAGVGGGIWLFKAVGG